MYVPGYNYSYDPLYDGWCKEHTWGDQTNAIDDGWCPCCLRKQVQELIEQSTKQAKELEESKAYAKRLVDGYAEGMLPKDIELMKEANAKLAQELHEARELLADIVAGSMYHEDPCIFRRIDKFLYPNGIPLNNWRSNNSESEA